ncbi:coiled-coil domain-containing protein [Planctopirus hydrillae]|uniref:Uncharacterized protein n=1 Tax=Planctopirus hydrillae TaxID=1841610 RepID=A0A1C3E6Q5_9PLAN|nr:hypothetical protein [Planctopirus hydrillae]ODA28930.1 hypothetical protein A6X21_10580 [Planctopirus hydrillae]
MNDICRLMAALLCLVCGWSSSQKAQAQPPTSRPVQNVSVESGESPSIRREVFVPLADLQAVLESQKRGVLLSRDDYEALLKKAQVKNNSPTPPVHQVITSGTAVATIEGTVLVINLKLELEQLTPGWVEWKIPGLERLSIDSARLDGEPAPLYRPALEIQPMVKTQQKSVRLPAPPLQLLTNEVGTHHLELQLTTPLVNAGSDQVAAFVLPPVPAGEIVVTVPPKKQLVSSGMTLDRLKPLTEANEYRLPFGGQGRFQWRLTERAEAKATDALLFASTAYGLVSSPGEVSWQALTSLQVFGRSIDRLELSVPSKLEVAAIESTGLEAWTLSDDPANPERTKMSLVFSQPFEGQRTLTVRGVMPTQVGEAWSVPPLKIDGATSHVGQLIVRHPQEVRLRTLEENGVRRSEGLSATPRSTAPAANNSPSDNNTYSSIDFEVWREDFELNLMTEPKARELNTAVAMVVEITARGIELTASTMVETRYVSLFDLEFDLPAEWKLLQASTAEGQGLTWQTIPGDAGINRIRVALDKPLLPGERRSIRFSARQLVENWPVEENAPVSLVLPSLPIAEATLTETAVVVRADEDLDVTARDLVAIDLAPLKAEDERLRLQSQVNNWKAGLNISRQPSRWITKGLTGWRLDQQSISSFVSVQVEVQGGGVRGLMLTLPESVGTDLRFSLTGAGGRIVQQQDGPVVKGRRLWILRFAERARGALTLWATIEQPRPEAEKFEVPELLVLDSQLHSGFIALEASPDQKLSIDALAADGSPLKEADLLELPSSKWVPRERLVALFETLAEGARVVVSEQRFDRSALPSAICRRLKVDTHLPLVGAAQHRAEFLLQVANVQNLSVQLPGDQGQPGQGSRLWAVMVDGRAVEARLASRGFLVPLSSRNEGANSSSAGSAVGGTERSVVVYYETDHTTAGRSAQASHFEGTTPVLNVVTSSSDLETVEVLEQTWEVHYPEKLLLVRQNGLLEATAPLDQPGELARLKELFQHASWERLIPLLLVAGLMILFTAGACYLRFKAGFWGCAGAGGLLALGLVLVVCVGPWFFLGGRAERHVAASRTAAPAASFYTDNAVEGFAVEPVEKSMKRLEESNGKPMSDIDALVPAFDAPAQAGEKIAESRKMLRAGAKPAAPPSGPASAAQTPLAAPAEPFGAVSDPAVAVNRPQPVAAGMPIPAEAGKETTDNKTPATPTPDARPATAGEGAETLTGRADQSWGVKSGTSRLSLALNWQAPAGTRSREFRYVGTGESLDGGEVASLKLTYLDRQEITLWGRWLFCMGALIAWFCRKLPATRKWLILGIGLPLVIGFSGVLPASAQLWLDGLFAAMIGGLMVWLGVALYSLIDLCLTCCLSRCGKTRWSGPGQLASLVVGLCLWSACTTPLMAQEEVQKIDQEAQKAMAPLPPSPPVNQTVIPVASGDLTDPAILEGSQQVFIPYEKYLELYLKANPDKRPQTAAPHAGGLAETTLVVDLIPKPQVKPAPGIAQDAQPAGTDEKATPAQSQWTHDVRLKARLVYLSRTSAPQLLALPLKQLAWNRAELDGKAAPLVSKDSQQQILITGEGLHVLDLETIIDRNSSPSAGQFQILLEPLTSGKLIWNLPKEGLLVRLNGATTGFRQIPARNDQPRKVEVSLSAYNEVSISWQPEGELNVANRTVSLNSLTALSFDDTGLKVSTGLEYLIRQGSVIELDLQVPPALKIQSVTGPDVGSWELSGEDPARKLKVYLRRNVDDTTRLTIDAYFELPVSQEPTVLKAPQLIPVGVTHETGTLGVFAARQFNVRVNKTELLTQIDTSRFSGSVPVSRPAAAPQFAYRFSARPYALELRVQRQLSRITAQAQHGVLMTPTRQQQTTRLIAQVSGVPRATLTLRLPKDWQPLRVESAGLQDWYETRTEGQHLLTLEWKTPREGTLEILLAGAVPFSRNGQNRWSMALELPELTDVDRLSSQVGLWTDSAITANFSNLEGWRSIDPATLSPGLTQLKNGQAPQLAFSSENQTTRPISLSLSRLEPQLAAESLSIVSVTDGAIAHSLLLNWQIARAAADVVEVSASPEFAGKLEFSGSEIRSIATSKGKDGRPRWTIFLRTPILGSLSLAAVATTEFRDLQVHSPGLRFETTEADRTNTGSVESIPQSHYVLLLNPSRSVLTREAPEQADAVTRDDLRIALNDDLIKRAAELLRVKSSGVSLKWKAVALTQARLAAASVNLADLVTILSRDGTYRTSATYLIKNRSRQFLPLVIPKEARLLTVLIDGAPSRAVQSSKDGQMIQLVALPRTSAADLSITVQITIAGKLNGRLPARGGWTTRQLDIPAPQVISPEKDESLGIPVSRTRWAVSIPDDLHATGLADLTRNNLNSASLVQSELSLQQARLQELSYLISIADNSTNFSLQAQALGNGIALKSLLSDSSSYRSRASGKDLAAVDEYETSLNATQKQLQELQRKVEQKGEKLNLQNQSLNVSGLAVNGIILGQPSEGALEAQSNALQILTDNRSQSQADHFSQGGAFWFKSELKENEFVQESAPSKKDRQEAREQLDARRQYQAFNDQQLDSLNSAVRNRLEESQQRQQVDLAKSKSSESLERYQSLSEDSAARKQEFDRGSQAVELGRGMRRNAADSIALQQRALGENKGQSTSSQSSLSQSTSSQWDEDGLQRAKLGVDKARDASARDGFFVLSEMAASSGGTTLGTGGLGGGLGGMVDFELPANRGAVSQGLSVVAELPQSGQTVRFSKAGGDARLALEFVPSGRKGSLWGWLWLLASIILAAWMVAIVTPDKKQRWLQITTLLLILILTIAALTLPPLLAILAGLGVAGLCTLLVVLATQARWNSSAIG